MRGEGDLTLGVLISGEGSNLQAILDAIAAGALQARVAVVVSNNPAAPGLARAAQAGVPHAVLERTRYTTRQAFDTELVRILQAHRVGCVVLAGFMQVVTEVLLEAFPWRVLNIHPSLLPAFPGLYAQRQALKYGARVTGCTVHLVDKGVDTGPLLAQAVVPVLPDDTEATLRQRIATQEHGLLPAVLQWIAEGRVQIEDTPLGRPRVSVHGAHTACGLLPRV